MREQRKKCCCRFATAVAATASSAANRTVTTQHMQPLQLCRPTKAHLLMAPKRRGRQQPHTLPAWPLLVAARTRHSMQQQHICVLLRVCGETAVGVHRQSVVWGGVGDGEFDFLLPLVSCVFALTFSNDDLRLLLVRKSQSQAPLNSLLGELHVRVCLRLCFGLVQGQKRSGPRNDKRVTAENAHKFCPHLLLNPSSHTPSPHTTSLHNMQSCRVQPSSASASHRRAQTTRSLLSRTAAPLRRRVATRFMVSARNRSNRIVCSGLPQLSRHKCTN